MNGSDAAKYRRLKEILEKFKKSPCAFRVLWYDMKR